MEKVEKQQYHKEWHQRNKERRNPILREQSKNRRYEYQAMIESYKSQPCLDCGNIFPTICMDLDHREPSEKHEGFKHVSAMSRFGLRYGKEALLVELQKCDIVCSNCHRIRTEKQRLSGLFTKDKMGA